MLAPDVVERLKAAAERAFRGRRVLAAYVFGSRVSGRPLPSSDLDVGYYLEGHRQGERLPVREELQVAGALSDAVGLHVDLRDLADAPLELRGRVLEEGVRLYSGDAAARVALERDLLARYHDYKDEFREMHETRLRAVASRGSSHGRQSQARSDALQPPAVPRRAARARDRATGVVSRQS